MHECELSVAESQTDLVFEHATSKKPPLTIFKGGVSDLMAFDFDGVTFVQMWLVEIWM